MSQVIVGGYVVYAPKKVLHTDFIAFSSYYQKTKKTYLHPIFILYIVFSEKQ